MILDLPPELIRPIFQHVVDVSDFRSAIALRQVCTHFDYEVMAIIEQDRLLGPDLERPAKKHQYSFMRFLARFLCHRPYARREGVHWSANSSAFLNQILDACGVTSFQDRLDGFETLFGMMNLRVASSPGCQGFSDFVLQNLRSWDEAPLYPRDARWINHLLPASIALRASHVYEPLLPPRDTASMDDYDHRVVSTRLKRPSKVFGAPLAVAAASSLPDVVRNILHFQADLMRRSSTHLLSVAAAAGGKAMVDLILEYELPRSWSLHSAIVRSADEGLVAIARTLLGYVQRTADRPYVDIPHALQEGLHAACVNGDRDMVLCFLEHGADLNQSINEDMSRLRRASTESQRSDASVDSNEVRPPPVSLAAWAGDDEFMGWLVKQGALLSGTFADSSPINGAILGDRVELVKALREAGADSQWSQFDWVDALYLCVEIHANRTLRYLLHDAKVVDMSAADFERDDLELGGLIEKMCKYGNVDAFDILVAAGMPMDRSILDIPGWTAMVVAQSYRSPEAEEIVAKLEGAGLRRLEVREMPYPERFESGEWPRRGSRSTPRMPHNMGLERRVCRPARRTGSMSSAASAPIHT